MKRIMLVWMLTFMMCTSLVLPAVASAAASDPVFKLTVTEVGSNVQVKIAGSKFVDLYAFDLKLTFDPLRMKLMKAVSPIHGFTVTPIVDGDVITFAHTKTGPVSGDKGDLTLGTLTFQRIGGGSAEFKLNEAMLVDSKLNSVSVAINLSKQVEDGRTLIDLKDISGHWAEVSIREAVEAGFVTGYPNGTFFPDKNVTRAEFAAMLVRALKLPDGAELTFSDAVDIPGWAKPFISAAVSSKAITGYSDNTFRADRLISRAEMVAMIVRGAEIEMNAGSETKFSDANEIAAWAKPYVAAAVDAGFIKGKGTNKFAPNDTATRAEAVTVLMNVLNSE